MSPSTSHTSNLEDFSHTGVHLMVDFWGAENLDDLILMEKTMREAVIASGATLLHIHLHHFTPNNGISAVALLEESHISTHTWPEKSFAAFDIFLCGNAIPEKAVPILQKAFKPSSVNLTKKLRGVPSAEARLDSNQ